MHQPYFHSVLGQNLFRLIIGRRLRRSPDADQLRKASCRSEKPPPVPSPAHNDCNSAGQCHRLRRPAATSVQIVADWCMASHTFIRIDDDSRMASNKVFKRFNTSRPDALCQ